MNFNLETFQSFLTEYGLLFGLAFVAAIAGLMTYKHLQSDERLLNKTFKKFAKEVRKDVVLFDGVDSYQFADYLVLLQGKILVIKLDASVGYIFGACNIHEWTCVEKNVTGKFANPLRKLNHFATQIKQEFAFDDVEACVLFGSKATFPKGVPEHVLQTATLEADIEKLVGDEAKHEQTEQAWHKLMAMVEKDKHEVGKPHS